METEQYFLWSFVIAVTGLGCYGIKCLYVKEWPDGVEALKIVAAAFSFVTALLLLYACVFNPKILDELSANEKRFFLFLGGTTAVFVFIAELRDIFKITPSKIKTSA